MNNFKDLQDDLGEVYSTAPSAPSKKKVYVETCSRCGGSGQYRAPSSYGPLCFDCQGTGKHTYSTSPEQRAKARQKSADNRAAIREKKEAAKVAKREAWIAANPAEHAWIVSNLIFDFAAAMQSDLNYWGSLTDGQLKAVQSCIAKSEARKAEKTEQEKTAPTVDVAAIEKAFATARGKGIRSPKLSLAVFKFKAAPAHGKNPGAIYVTQGDSYLGKVQGGRFLKSRDCNPEIETEVLAVASDPHSAAVAYGKRFGACAVCGRELTNHESIDLGIGPICRDKMGW